MMTAAQVRNLLDQLALKNAQEENPVRALAWCGGISALKMVLEEQ